MIKEKENSSTTLVARLRHGGFSYLASAIENNNSTSNFGWSNMYYNLIIGSDLVSRSNGITLEKRYAGVESACYMYGARGCYVTIDWLNSATGEELHMLDEDLKSIERDYPLLSDDDYSEIQDDMIDDLIECGYSDFTDEEKKVARGYLYGCSFYADMIDYSESDLLDYVKAAV